jgi:amino acid adenylation domain-containing protein
MKNKNIDDIYPLSPLQQGMLFYSLSTPGSEVYVEQLHCTLAGEMNAPAFEAAWQEVIDRHAILRTAFVWEKLERPLQVVRKRVPLPLEKVDWRSMPAAAREEELARFLAADRAKGFVLSKAPLMRLTLIRTGERSHRFVWCHHHLLLDGWSTALLLKDLFDLYEARVEGREIRLPRPRPYGDYIEWLGKQDLGKAESFWRAALQGFSAPTSLRVDRPTAAAGAAGAAPPELHEQGMRLPEAEAAALAAFAKQNKLTQSTLVQGAWALLLHRYSGERDVVFGATVSGRAAPIEGIEGIVGMCINMMPVRVRVPAGATVLPWLRTLQEGQAELRDYEHSPLVEVQGWSEVPRGQALFESILTFENYPLDESIRQGAKGLSVEDFHALVGSSYPITVVCLPGRELTFRVAYDGARFDAPTIARMLGHLRTLLEGMAAHPEALVAELPIVAEEERRVLLGDWNATAASFPPGATLHRLFEAQAKRTPEAPAVASNGRTLAYAELNRRANQVGRHLRRLGVGAEAVVGICVSPSVEMIVALLGVLKAGGAYVPLDPGLPAERLAGMMEDAGARVLLAEQALAAGLPLGQGRLVSIDADWNAIAEETGDDLPGGAGSGNLAYVLFTSGSTGRPKGVAIEHRALVNYVRGVSERLSLPEGASYALVSTFSADLGNTMVFPSLCLGGSLHVLGPAIASDADAAAAYLHEHRIDCLKIVPSHLSALLSAAHPEQVIPARRLVLGGEASSWELMETVHSLDAECRVFNHYGPTETTVGVLTYPVKRGQRDERSATVPLGRPLPNSRIYLLDEAMQPVPLGVPGELYIGGDGLARGYLNRPDLTSERFVPSPFDEKGGARLYRTGDLARYLPDGSLSFLGRIDHQVKIRGFRIELGEIEAALAEHPAVRASVVLVQADEAGKKRLVAYVVPASAPGPTPAELRETLERKLPDYMIPSAFVSLEALPLTANGKVDRAALLATSQEEAPKARFVAPRNPVEEVLAGIWASVFEVDRVGVLDDFTELGGHSLLAIQVIARTRDAFQVEVPLRALFDAPTVAGLSERVEEELHAGAGIAIPPLVPVPREGELFLSFGQERLWFLSQLEPDSPFYNVPAAVRLAGRLDVEALEKALIRVVERHEVLRTTFTTVGGKPRPVIHAEAGVRLPLVDATAVSAAGREAWVRARAAEEARRPFDLSRGPLVRAQLLRLAGEEHVLLLSMHHIVSDAWTRGVLVREMGALYEAFSRSPLSSSSPLPDLPVQYLDYAHWQRSLLRGEVLERQIAYWKKQLGGAPHALEMPTDRPRPPVQTFRGARQSFDMPPALLAALEALARREGATLYMTLLAAFDVLLSRYSGQEDIVVGTSAADRRHAETAGLIGYFLNQLALRVDLSGEPTFVELLARVREVSLGAYAHRDMPFERVVEELRPSPDRSRTPIFQVMMDLQLAPVPEVTLADLTVTPLEADTGTARFDLTLGMGRGEGGLVASLEYNTDLFDDTTIGRMLGHLRRLLEGIVVNPETRIGELPLLTDAERRQLLIEWNDTAADFPSCACVHELFEAQAARTPEAIALRARGETLTYGELERRGNQLASYLRMLGVGAEARVGLCVGRSFAMVVGILGTLKAGGAYVPLDPAYPLERLAWMLEDSGVPVVLTEERLEETLPAQAAMVVRLDADWPMIAEQSGERVAGGATPASLAYVIYTSGSTGKPKGAMVHHRGVVNYLSWAAREYEVAAGGGAPVHSSVAFDLTVTSLFAPLVAGRTVTLVPEDGVGDVAALGEALRAGGDFSLVKLTPAHLEILGQSIPAAEAAGRTRVFVIGGEALSWETLAFWRRNAPGTRLINEYGPTETVVGCCTYEAPPGETRPAGSVPIGRPIANTQLYVLDRHQELVPIGVHGELYVGGAGVGLGYLNRPELTAEKFVKSPFATHTEAASGGGGDAGARLYRTGDLARYLPDGTLEFLGRIDHQVKVRGYRIELGEIEATLGQHPSMRETVVVVREDTPGDKRLVAYFVTEEGAELATTDLRAFLAEKLPEYMVPAAFVELPAMPLTPNGKVDRRALPAPELQGGVGEAAHVAPSTPIEEVLAGIWAELLGVERIGAHDGFFELGGHSLLATQVLSRIRGAFQVELPFRAIFEAPTVTELAERVEAALREGLGVEGPAMVPVPRDGHLELSFAQERLWFLNQLEPNNPFYNVPGAIRLLGHLDVGALERSLREVIRRHEVLRAAFTETEGRAQIVIAARTDFALRIADHGDLPAAEQAAITAAEAKAEAGQAFDLSQGSLVRAKLLRLGDEEHVLLLTMHHIVSDGWSTSVLLREVGTLYDAFTRGEPSPLPELVIQYADYAHWQRRWFRGVFERQLAYWKKQLTGAPRALDLPTDRPRPPIQTYKGARQALKLPASLGAALGALGRHEGSTLFMTLLGAFQVLLHRYTAAEDVVVGTPIANRTRTETETLIGFFVNTLVLRTDLSREPTGRELLARVREVSLGSYAHQDMPFERLVDELSPERDLSRPPLFQVLFVMQNAPSSPLRLPGLLLREVDAEIVTAKFDLALFMAEGQDWLVGSKEGLMAWFEYNTDLFEGATITRMMGHFQALLEGLAASPDQRIWQLPLLGDAERETLLVEWNRSAMDYPRDIGLHGLFEAQADRTPEAVAVVFQKQELTYRELDVRSNQLAHYLRKRGAGPDVLIGLCVERTLDMLVGMLGILKSGGAYVPLDPAYPKDRVAYTLREAKAPLLLTQQRLLGGLPDQKGEIVRLDADWAEIAKEDTARPASGVRGNHLAYTLFTSGSTGRPKGVAIEHHSPVALVRWAATVYPPEELAGVLFSTSMCFDLSVFEVFVPLGLGGKVIMAENALELPTLPAAGDVTLINTVPSAMAELLRMDGVPASAGTINLAGEPLSDVLAQQIFEKPTIRRLLNLYGPTEDTTYSTFAEGVKGGPAPPIGRPIANGTAYILDAHLQPVPIGVPAELYLGGEGLARGYLYRPELTEERFVENPFAPGSRLYRTGDLIRYLPDGTMQYVGRIDHQVKVRGFRIELGEVEAVLAQQPAVRESAVVVWEASPGDKRLVAYVVLDPVAQESDEKAPGTAEDRESRTSQWQAVYEETYRQEAAGADPRFNIVGWISSYDGMPIPADQMQAWVDGTVARILALGPKRVLEIGCGTGLLLFRIAPKCEEYVGLDFSEAALRHIEAQRGAFPEEMRGVHLLQRTADNLAGFDAGSFDTVVINSVAQYFPSIDYLAGVIEGAAGLVRPGGHVFVGDVRSLPLLKAFHASVALHQAAPSLPAAKVYEAMQRGALAEEELVVDPGFFVALARRVPGIGRVEVSPKRGRYGNELSRFRYDVLLHVGETPPEAEVKWLDFRKEELTLRDVHARLGDGDSAMLGITAVPNARVARYVRLVELLGSQDRPATAGELREAVSASTGLHPEDFFDLTNREPSESWPTVSSVELSLLSGRADGAFDVVLRREAPWIPGVGPIYPLPEIRHQEKVARFPAELLSPRPYAHYANNPLRGVVAERAVAPLKAALAEKLPDYMVPSTFVLLDALPLTPNGKLDRRALPAPETRVTAAETSAPKNPVEEVLAGIWGEVLQLERVGTRDNFFDLGGHSLLATRVISRIRNAFRVSLPVRSVFEAPTVAALAERVEAELRVGAGAVPPPIVRIPRGGSLPVSFAQQRLWMLHQLDPANPSYNVPASVRLTGRLDVEALARVLGEVVRRHEVLRTTFRVVDGLPRQVIHPERSFALSPEDLSDLSPAEKEDAIRREVAAEAVRTFDLERGPLVRARLLRVGPEDHVLLFSMHHIVSDGWSMSVLMREVGVLYEAFSTGRASPLPELPLQYADYAHWQRQWLDGNVLEEQLAYWRRQLAGAPKALELPTDRPRPPVQTFRGARLPLDLPPALVKGVEALARKEGVTLFMTLLAAFDLLLFRVSGQEDLVVGTSIAERSHPETEGLIGFFVNTLVLRTDLSGEPTFRDLLARVREALLGAYAHKEVPFERVVEDLHPELDRSRTPLFQVMAVLQNTPVAELSLPGLTLAPVNAATGTAKFDLTLFFAQSEAGLASSVVYNTDLFNEATVSQMMSQLRALLEGVVADPGQRLWEVPLMTERERRQMLLEWSGD